MLYTRFWMNKRFDITHSRRAGADHSAIGIRTGTRLTQFKHITFPLNALVHAIDFINKH